MKLLKAILLCTLLLATFQIPTGIETPLVVSLTIMIVITCVVAAILVLTQKLPRLIWLWVLFALLVIFNICVAWINGLNLLVWAKYTLPILAWPASATITYYVIRSREEAFSLYKWVVLILAVPIAIFLIALLANIPKVLGAGNLETLRELTIWSEGIGHFGILLILLTLPFIKNTYALITVLVGASALVLSSVRSLWISLILTFVIMLLVIFRARSSLGPNEYLDKISRRLIVTAIVSFCIIIALLFVLSPIKEPIINRARSLIEVRVVGDVSYKERAEEAKAMVKDMVATPSDFIAGAGAGAYYYYLPTRFSLENQGAYSNYSHDFYLHLLWNYGIIVLVVFLIGLIQILRRSYSLMKSADQHTQEIALGITVTVIATAIVANVSSFYNYSRWYILFGILTGIVCFLSSDSSVMPLTLAKPTKLCTFPLSKTKVVRNKTTHHCSATIETPLP